MTLAVPGPTDQREPDGKTVVARAALLAAGGFISTIATILVVAGVWGIADGVVRYALTMVGVIAGIGLFSAAFISRK
jgi:hypothetical protein